MASRAVAREVTYICANNTTSSRAAPRITKDSTVMAAFRPALGSATSLCDDISISAIASCSCGIDAGAPIGMAAVEFAAGLFAVARTVSMPCFMLLLTNHQFIG